MTLDRATASLPGSWLEPADVWNTRPFDALAAHLQSPLLLVIRLYWGISFAQTGWGKLTHLDRTASFFASPATLSIVAVLTLP